MACLVKGNTSIFVGKFILFLIIKEENPLINLIPFSLLFHRAELGPMSNMLGFRSCPLPAIAGHWTTCLKVSDSHPHLGQVGSRSREDQSFWAFR